MKNHSHGSGRVFFGLDRYFSFNAVVLRGLLLNSEPSSLDQSHRGVGCDSTSLAPW